MDCFDIWYVGRVRHEEGMVGIALRQGVLAECYCTAAELPVLIFFFGTFLGDDFYVVGSCVNE